MDHHDPHKTTPADHRASQGGDHEGHQGHEGHDQHAGHSVAMFRDRFWLSLVLTLPVVFYSETIQGWFGYTAPSFPGSEWLSPILGTVIFIYGGSPFLKGAVREARDRQPAMMLLIGMAITVAYAASLATTFGWFDLEFWWELAGADHHHAAGPLDGDARHRPGPRRPGGSCRAPSRRGGADHRPGVERIPASEIAVGDLVLVRPGGRVPADGVIEEGRAEIDESMVTGESRYRLQGAWRRGCRRNGGHRQRDPGAGGGRG